MARAIRKEPTKAQKIAPIQFSWYICNLNKKKESLMRFNHWQSPKHFFPLLFSTSPTVTSAIPQEYLTYFRWWTFALGEGRVQM